MSSKFELPNSPDSTQNEETSDDDVEFIGIFLNEAQGAQTNIVKISSNLETMATVLATPPLSPQDNNNLQPKDMPSLTAMLSHNYAGYIVHIPCFLCQQPFSDIERLREHLTMHAKQLNIPIINDRPPAQPILPTELYCGPPLRSTSLQHAVSLAAATPAPPVNATIPEATHLTCKVCGRVLKSALGLTLHERSHNNPQRKKWVAKAFKCHLCKKSYRRHTNLLKHMTFRHGIRPINEVLPSLLSSALDPASATISNLASAPAAVSGSVTNVAAAAEPPAVLPTVPRPIQPKTPPMDDEQKPSKKIIWSTKLLNAVAAANYSPAMESASKYIAPTEETAQQSAFKPKPKQKYALRSPFCNPNLWVDYDNHIP
ncbi:hypothetical protein KR093_011268 [Drosophila rubida]|uniref:C2H2-type domain-containing protein n=1 Tax=Drosophila rubida TaxID=30044 RepID=A0AAD4PMA3_9MUSC|nr:hypothetical protein KR093_011268 [Drosophila rubida]